MKKNKDKDKDKDSAKQQQEALRFSHAFYEWWEEHQEEVLNQSAEMEEYIAEKWPFDTIETETNFPLILACLTIISSKVFVSMNAPDGAPKIVMQRVYDEYKGQVISYVNSRIQQNKGSKN